MRLRKKAWACDEFDEPNYNFEEHFKNAFKKFSFQRFYGEKIKKVEKLFFFQIFQKIQS